MRQKSRILRIVCRTCSAELYSAKERDAFASPRTAEALMRQAAEKHPCEGGDVRFFLDSEEFSSLQEIALDSLRTRRGRDIRRIMGAP